MISQYNYDFLKNHFGNVASWAIWREPGETPKSNMGDLSIFDDPDLLEKLNPNVVFVGLNASGKHENYLKTEQPWFNFHSGAPTSNSFKLRFALMGTALWGGYITDIIKFYKEADSTSVGRFIKQHPEIVKENISIFREELSLLNDRPLLIALGGKSYELLKEHLADKYQIEKMTHYSAQFSYRDIYPREVAEILSRMGK